MEEGRWECFHGKIIFCIYTHTDIQKWGRDRDRYRYRERREREREIEGGRKEERETKIEMHKQRHKRQTQRQRDNIKISPTYMSKLMNSNTTHISTLTNHAYRKTLG